MPMGKVVWDFALTNLNGRVVPRWRSGDGDFAKAAHEQDRRNWCGYGRILTRVLSYRL